MKAEPAPVVLRPTFAALALQAEPIQPSDRPSPLVYAATRDVATPDAFDARLDAVPAYAPEALVAKPVAPGAIAVGWAYQGNADHFEVTVAGATLQVPGSQRDLEVTAIPAGEPQSVSVAAIAGASRSATTETTVVVPALPVASKELDPLAASDKPTRIG